MSSSRSIWGRIRDTLLQFLDQFFMIMNLPTFTSSLQGRMRRLRGLYYRDHTLTIDDGRIRDVLRGHVDKKYRSYYERLLSVEREVYLVTGRMQYTQTPDDLLNQTQQLTDRIVKLIEQLQDAEQLLKIYRDPSAPQAHIAYQRRQLLQARIDEALHIHFTIPTAITGLKDVQEEREMVRLGERIQRLTLQLEDIEESYGEIEQYGAEPTLVAARLRNLDEE
jgi:hypothetical protein